MNRVQPLGVVSRVIVVLALSLGSGCNHRDNMRSDQRSPVTAGVSKSGAKQQGGPDPEWIPCILGNECPLSVMWKAFARCGGVEVNRRFVGRYEVDASRSFTGPLFDPPDADAKKKELAAWFLKREIDQFSNFVVDSDRIRSGKQPVQEFCFIDVQVETDHVLDVIAVWHEDVNDPGDASLIRVRIERDGDDMRFHFYGEEKDLKEPPIFLRAMR